MINNKKTSLVLILLLLAISVVGFKLAGTNNGNDIAFASSTQIDNPDIEYLKVKNPEGYSEHWRDLKTLKEKADTYNNDGQLVNRIIVTEKGKRVVSIGYDQGTMEAFTWILPESLSEENKNNLSKSLLEDIKNELKKPKWIFKGTEKLEDGKTVKIIEASFEDLVEVVYVDDRTNFPVKREFFKKENGQLKLVEMRTEEYKKVTNQSGTLFEYGGIQVKEIAAPVVEK